MSKIVGSKQVDAGCVYFWTSKFQSNLQSREQGIFEKWDQGPYGVIRAPNDAE